MNRKEEERGGGDDVNILLRLRISSALCSEEAGEYDLFCVSCFLLICFV